MKGKLIMKHLLKVVTFIMILSLSLSADSFSIKDIDVEDYVKSYNGLCSVEKADSELKSNTLFREFLTKAKDIIVKHDLQEYVGLRLIHRHFDVQPQQVMIENFELREGVPSLITSSQSISSAYEPGVFPASWILSEDGLSIFEFSRDSAVFQGVNIMKDNELFIDEMRNLMIQNGVSNLLSISILKRNSIDLSLASLDSGKIYVERNFGDLQKSIVQLENNVVGGIHTSWSFHNQEGMNCCCYPSSVCLDTPHGHVEDYAHC